MQPLDNYIITYSNHFKIGDKTFAFRKKELFDISNNPMWLQLKDNNGSKGYWINRSWYSLTKIKTLILNEDINVNVSNLAWNIQIDLDEVFNLK